MQHSAVLVDRVLVNRMLLQTYMAGRVSRGFGLRSELSKQKSVKKQPWLLVRKCVQVLVCKCTSLPRCGRGAFTVVCKKFAVVPVNRTLLQTYQAGRASVRKQPWVLACM